MSRVWTRKVDFLFYFIIVFLRKPKLLPSAPTDIFPHVHHVPSSLDLLDSSSVLTRPIFRHHDEVTHGETTRDKIAQAKATGRQNARNKIACEEAAQQSNGTATNDGVRIQQSVKTLQRRKSTHIAVTEHSNNQYDVASAIFIIIGDNEIQLPVQAVNTRRTNIVFPFNVRRNNISPREMAPAISVVSWHFG